MADLQLKNVYKVYDGGVRAVSDFCLDIKDKQFVVFVGPSGCGKSTTLRMIAGLEEITAGNLYLDGVRVNDVEPKDRNIAMVFQNYALYPHMTVFQNMAFGLKIRKLSAQEIEQRVNRAAEILGITDLLTRKPKALSGGQRQRVALGRAIVREPSVFLLDEPLSNLDAKLRVQMRTEITKLHKRLATTFVYVTHDQTEAMTMGDTIVVMKDGYIQQADTPTVLYEEPCNEFVASFLGSPQMNIFEANLSQQDGKLSVSFGSNKVDFSVEKSKQLADDNQIGNTVCFGIRPENISLDKAGVPATVDIVEHLGSETIIYAKVDGVPDYLVVKIPSNHGIVGGQQVMLNLDTDKAHLFDVVTRKSVMGVPAVNAFDCTLSGGKLAFAGLQTDIPPYFAQRLFDFADGCSKLIVDSSKITLEQIDDAFAIPLTVEFVVSSAGSCAVYGRLANGAKLTFRTTQQVASGDKLVAYVPYIGVSLCNADGVRVNSREIVSDNTATCTTATSNGKTTLRIGSRKLVFDDLHVADGKHTIRLISDKMGFVYDGKYARKNKPDKPVSLPNTVVAKSYDEDVIGGGKNAVFVKVDGFDNYVTAVIDDKFSVYDMPNFKLVIPAEAIVFVD